VPAPVTVRRADQTDAEGLSRLAALTFPLACTPRTPADFLATHIASRLDPMSFRRHVGDPACTVLLAEDEAGGDPVGYTMLLLEEPIGRKRFAIGDAWEDDVVRERVLRTP
jgi:diamine N-acetyltransferase